MNFEDLYKHELEHTEALRAGVSLPLGVLVVVGGLLGTMLQSMEIRYDIAHVLFWLLVAVTTVPFVLAAYFLIRAYHGHEYKAMPFALDQKAYRDGLREWHRSYGEGAENGDLEYTAYLEQHYAEAAQQNGHINETRSEYLFQARRSLIFCVVLTGLTFVPYEVARRLSPNPVQRIQIVNEAEIHVSQETTMPDDKPKPPPPKPPPPPLRNLREGQIPAPPKPAPPPRKK